jgi:prolyl-tRNA synthetase
VGNIFKLGTKYSMPFDLKFTDRDGEDKSVLMGCYGIGLGRLMGAIVESSHDEKGIIWPQSVAPFTVHLIHLGGLKVKTSAAKVYKSLQEKGVEVLWDDRETKTAGEKFAEADLLGIPNRIVVSEKTLEKHSVELKERSRERVQMVKLNQLVKVYAKKN